MYDHIRKKTRREYKTLFTEVRKIINRYDPIGLMPSAPEDEYDLEVSRILPLLKKAKSAEDLALGIHQVFVKMFDYTTAGSVTAYKKLAEEIWDYWSKRK